MATVTFILGLCGAGKSWLANQVNADIKFHEGFCLPDRREANMRALIATLRGGGDAVVVEIALCEESSRQEIVGALSTIQGLAIRWVCIENDLRKANENCRRRAGHGDADVQVRINDVLSPRYTYPIGADVRPMWPYADDQASF